VNDDSGRRRLLGKAGGMSLFRITRQWPGQTLTVSQSIALALVFQMTRRFSPRMSTETLPPHGFLARMAEKSKRSPRHKSSSRPRAERCLVCSVDILPVFPTRLAMRSTQSSTRCRAWRIEAAKNSPKTRKRAGRDRPTDPIRIATTVRSLPGSSSRPHPSPPGSSASVGPRRDAGGPGSAAARA
jgi:hypothetical protein